MSTRQLLYIQVKKTFFTCPPLSHSQVLVQNRKLRMPEEPCPAPTPPVTPREELEVDSLALWTAKPVLPHTHFAQGCPSPSMRQPSASYKGDHRLSHGTTCPYPSPATVSAVQMTLMATIPQMIQTTLMAPLQKSRQIHHAYRWNHQQQGQAWTHLPHKMSGSPQPRSQTCHTQ